MREQIGNLFISIAERIAGKKLYKVDLKTVERMLIDDDYKSNFSVRDIREKSQEWIIELEERKELVPAVLKGKDVVFNGFMNMVEIIDHPFKGKMVYLRFYRRKWKERGKKESYSNEYKLHPEGMKATPKFGNFLKELTRQERDEFFCAFPDIRHLWKEDF